MNQRVYTLLGAVELDRLRYALETFRNRRSVILSGDCDGNIRVVVTWYDDATIGEWDWSRIEERFDRNGWKWRIDS